MNPVYGGLGLHPRGFLGAYNPQPKARDSGPVVIDMIGTATRRVVIDKEPGEISSNEQIDKCFLELANSFSLGNDVAFRERVYTLALTSFGRRDFYQWYLAQKRSPYFDTLQQDFVEDTLRFLMTGRRNVEISSWFSILRLGQQNAFDVGTQADKYFGLTSTRTNQIPNHPMPQVIQDWMRHDRGFTDLVFTLKILFGKA